MAHARPSTYGRPLKRSWRERPRLLCMLARLVPLVVGGACPGWSGTAVAHVKCWTACAA